MRSLGDAFRRDKPISHSWAHHITTYVMNNEPVPLDEAQAARDEHEDTAADREALRSSLSTVTRERDEAVALLRDVAQRLDGYDGPGATRLRLVSQASSARAFLSRLSSPTGDGGAR